MIGPSLALASLAMGSTLEAVDVRPADARARVVLAGTAPPNFSAFVESNPHRIVIDWAGGRVDSLAAARPVSHPDIREIRLEERITESELVTRVSIVLERLVTFELRSERTEVWIDLDVDGGQLGAGAPSARPSVATIAPARDRSPTQPPDGLPPGARGRPRVERAVEIPDVEAAPEIPEAEPVTYAATDWALPPVEMEPGRAAALAAAEARAEARAREAAAAEARAREAARAEARVQEAELPAARASALGPADAPAPAGPPIAELDPTTDDDAGGAEPSQGSAADARPEPGPASPAPQAPAVLARFRPDPPPAAAPPPPAAEPPPAPERASRAARASTPALEREHPARPVVLARFAPSRAGPDDAVTTGDEWDPGPHVMTYIGFRQRDGISRVFVRLDGRARFRQYQDRATFVLELMDTSVNVENNQRPLDTTYFEGPVASVRARPVGSSTRIEVKLRATAPWQIKRIGNTIAVDFEHADRR